MVSVVAITESGTLTPDRTYPTPKGALSSLGTLLDTLSRGLGRPSATVLLGASPARVLGLPTRLGVRGRRNHPSVEDARRHGWKVSELGPWFTAHRMEVRGSRESRALHVGVLPWLDAENCQLWDDDLPTMLARMRRFSDVVGVPYAGKQGGLAGIALLRQLPRKKGHVPLWQPKWDGVPPAESVREIADAEWEAPQPSLMPIEVGADCFRQYLRAILTSEVSINRPERTGPLPVSRYNAHGWYLIVIPPWGFEDRCPHPAGIAQTPGERAWVAAPTLDYLAELGDEHGVMSVPEVIDSWTAPGARVLRTWAEALAQALDRAEPDEIITKAVKGCYRYGVGLMSRDGTRVVRPDIADSVRALARVNFHRQIWRAGQTHGQWPTRIKSDTVWYPGTVLPPSFTLRSKDNPRGTFRPLGVRELAV